MYKTIDLKEKPSDFTKRIRDYWEQNNIFEKSIKNRNSAKQFIFFEGPPTANGKPGIHHMISRSIKDSVCRYKTMQGFQVNRKAGWDTHGLPVEIEVEKILGLKNKNDVEIFGIEEFNKKCKESVFSYEIEWQEMTKAMGYWIDLRNPYITLDNNYIETIWWILKQFFDAGLIYKGHKIVPYCPSCGTPLSSHEVAQGYKEVEDPSVYVKFKVKEQANTYFLAWTTTPWTLISNVALVVNPTEKYVKIKEHNPTTSREDIYLILAKDRLNVLENDYEIVDEYIGNDLEFIEYEQLFTYITPIEKAFFVACADYVNMEDGTGIVHTAPAFGQDDYTIGIKYSLPFIQPVDDAGRFVLEITDFQGQFVKDADKNIIRDLKERNLLYKRSQIIHTYPFCWRCKNPLIYYARSTWYIKTTEIKQEMIDNNAKVNWFPSFVGEKRFGDWLENNIDWALSRDRFWGTPLNIWKCDDCKEMICIGSISELREKGTINNTPVLDTIELHRPYVDKIMIKCPKCDMSMYRTPEVIDCWFDSGAMPFAQWHYPFENKERFESELFPADFICEGIDQTRGWFYTLLVISTFLKNKSPYKNVLVNDLILDKKGQKMSKSIGNTVDPMQLMEKYGADAIRWYLLYVSSPWTPTKFNEDDAQEIYLRYIGTLRNVLSFYVTYAKIDNYTPWNWENKQESNERYTNPRTRSYLPFTEIDNWIISKLHSLIIFVTENNEKYDFTRSLRAIQKFVIDDLSNWYVRRSRRRYWAMELTEDKKAAYMTLYDVLVDLSKLIAPFAPFIAEDIYTSITFRESVHLENYPVANEKFINKILEREMDILINLVTMGRSARNQAQIKVRQPLQAIYIPEKHRSIVMRMTELIKEEINVKEVKYLPDENDLVSWCAKLNMKIAGPKYGKDVRYIGEYIDKANIQEILNHFKEKKEHEFNGFKLTEEDLIISIMPKEGLTFENNNTDFIVLDSNITEVLLLEGYARELVNKIQFTRKENNFEIMDRIRVFYACPDTIKEVFSLFTEYIAAETLTNEFINVGKPDENMKKWDINDIEVYLKIEIV